MTYYSTDHQVTLVCYCRLL